MRISIPPLVLIIGCALLSGLMSGDAEAAPVDLNTWTAESYPAVSGFPAGIWTVSAGGATVVQSQNGQPTFFYSDFNVQGSDVRGSISVQGSDDDYIGFALGFNPGDSANPAADYLLVDWKRNSQFFNFGSPSDIGGGTAQRGLAVSRVAGIPMADEFWQHTNDGGNAAGGLQELARGATLGDAPWTAGVSYDFRFIFTTTSLSVFVNDALEMQIAGSFNDGRMGFYNFSQAGVTYDAFTIDPAPDPDPDPMPIPTTVSLFVAGLAGLGATRRRRQRSH